MFPWSCAAYLLGMRMCSPTWEPSEPPNLGIFMEASSRSHDRLRTQSLAPFHFLEDGVYGLKVLTFLSWLSLSGDQPPPGSPPRVSSLEKRGSYHQEIPRRLGAPRQEPREKYISYRITTSYFPSFLGTRQCAPTNGGQTHG